VAQKIRLCFLVSHRQVISKYSQQFTGKNDFVTATKLGTTNKILLLQPKILPQQPNVLLIEPNILLLQQNIFVIPILTNDIFGIIKPFSPC